MRSKLFKFLDEKPPTLRERIRDFWEEHELFQGFVACAIVAAIFAVIAYFFPEGIFPGLELPWWLKESISAI